MRSVAGSPPDFAASAGPALPVRLAAACHTLLRAGGANCRAAVAAPGHLPAAHRPVPHQSQLRDSGGAGAGGCYQGCAFLFNLFLPLFFSLFSLYSRKHSLVVACHVGFPILCDLERTGGLHEPNEDVQFCSRAHMKFFVRNCATMA